jgi:branched-chain amino acid transport system substrate-binding protein
MVRKLSILLVALLTISLLISGCTPAAPEETAAEDDVIKIGVFEPMTGANAAGGELEVEGVRLANRLYPEVLGKKVELVIVDNKSDAVEAASAAALLVEKEKVAAIIGSWGSSFSMAAGDIIRDKIPTVGASCTNPLVTLGNDWYYRVCFIDPFQGKVMATYAYEKLGAKKTAIIQEINNDYAIGLAKFYTDAFVELTGDDDAIVAVANYNTGDNDFSAQLTNINTENPDVIFAPGNFTESALIVKQARQLGITTPIIGGDTYETPEFVDIGGDAVEGTVFSTFFTSEIPITKESETFLAEYRAEYGKEPAAVTALAYDAYILILDAIERAGSTDPAALNAAIAATQGFEGAAGIISLDENGDAVKNAVIKQVKDGEFVYLDTVEPK